MGNFWFTFCGIFTSLTPCLWFNLNNYAYSRCKKCQIHIKKYTIHIQDKCCISKYSGSTAIVQR